MNLPSSLSNTNDWLIENLPYKIMWMEESGNITYANSLFLNRLGYRPKDIAALTIFDINPGVNAEIWNNHWQEVKTKKQHNFKSVHQTKDKKFYDVEIFAQFFSNNGKELILAVVSDISESSFYRNLLGHTERMTNVGGWKLNLQDGSIIVTEQAMRIFNSEDKDDFLPGNIIHFFKEEDEYRSLLSKAMRNGSVFDVVLTCRTKTGLTKYIRCVCHPILKRNKIYKLVGAYQDVTEQHVKENRLKFFRELIDNTEDLLYVYNRSGKLVHYSDSVAKELGFSKKELDGFSIYDLDQRITHEWWEGHFNEIIEKGAVYLDWEITRKNGTTFPASIVANHLVYNGEDINCAIIRDLSNLRAKDSELQTFKDIADYSNDLIYLRNKDFHLTYYNKTLEQYLLLDKADIRDEAGNLLIDRVAPSYNKERGALTWEQLEKEAYVTLESELTLNGVTRYFKLTTFFVDYRSEKNLVCIARDITATKNKEYSLEDTITELSSTKQDLERDNLYLRNEIIQQSNFENIICESDSYRSVLTQVTQVAVTDATVLITGESGTGKELLASAIHLNSQRNNKPFIKINCATLPKELIESELFGHKKGAFTGAVNDKLGKFSLADKGSIFLDEIGELPIELQSKLLRVLQEGEFDVLGGRETTKVDVRIIAATNRNLEEMVRQGSFREDLYYRLNVFPIHNIPLRERKEDIPKLAQFFLEQSNAIAGKSFKRLSKRTIDGLMSYSFPGNIRELKNLIERAVIVETGTTLQPGNWMPSNAGADSSVGFQSFEKMQHDYIVRVLEHTNWRVSGPKGAATILNMKDKTLFAKMKRLGIEKRVSLKN